MRAESAYLTHRRLKLSACEVSFRSRNIVEEAGAALGGGRNSTMRSVMSVNKFLGMATSVI